MSETDKKEHYFFQGNPYRFQSTVYAPEKGSNVPRFALEIMVYVSGSGWDIVNIYNSGNELLIAARDYIRLKESLGYMHLGKSSEQLTNLLTNIWGSNKWDNTKK